MSDKENKDLQNTVDKLMSTVDEQNNNNNKRFGFVACLVDSDTGTFSVIQNCKKELAMSIIEVVAKHIMQGGDGPEIDPKDLN